MHFIFDNVAATVIAGVLFLMLVAVNHRGRTAAVESPNYHAVKQQELTFVETLTRDLQNVTELYDTTEDPSTMEFEFEARIDPADTSGRTVTYRRVLAGVGGKTDLYRIERYVDGASSGGSTSTIAAWQVSARNEEGVQVDDVDDARQIYVRFEAVQPYREKDTIERARWEGTFRPPLLQQASTL